jgi:hypothetical protein
MSPAVAWIHVAISIHSVELMTAFIRGFSVTLVAGVVVCALAVVAALAVGADVF